MRLARHRITTAALLEHIGAFYRHPDDPARDHPRASVWRRLIDNTGVQQRWWTRPLEEVTAPSGVGRRTEVAFNDALDLGEHAAREAMATIGLGAADIDAIATSHTTSFSVPNLDVHLVERLGLRPDVSRMPLASLACSGGAQALIRALDYTTARPGARVLVVVAETLSTIYHQSETTPLSMMYRALFGDSAAACVVTGVTKSTAEGLPPGFLALDPFELVMPNSLDRYWGVIDEEGLHFASTKAAASAASDALPHIVHWLDERPLEWAAIHPGGPRIIDEVLTGVGLNADKDGRHSHASLAENGNLGGAAVLDVLRRTHDNQPAPGAPGALAAFGPGFTVAALYGNWT